MQNTIDLVLDMKGSSCPIPIVKTAKAMKEMGPRQVIEVLATDPGSVPDFTAWTKSTGNLLLESGEAGGVYRFLIQKKEA